MKLSSSRGCVTNTARRRLVQGLTVSGVAAASGLSLFPSTSRAQGSPNAAGPEILSGTEFDLTLGSTSMNFSGRLRPTTSVNGSVPGPTLRWREGTTVTLRVHNTLPTSGSIHWHGIILPFYMDGVPGISFPGIPAGETFTYQFPVRQSGTYWYHSHTRFQEVPSREWLELKLA